MRTLHGHHGAPDHDGEAHGISRLRTLAPPAIGNRIHYDTEVAGFEIRITAAGARSFVLNYRAGGRERRITIGSFPTGLFRRLARRPRR